MKEKLDYKTLRLFPYVIFAMIVAIMISMLSPLIQMFISGDVDEAAMYQMNDSLFMLCYFFTYMAIIGILSCLYHLSIINRWFGVSCNMTAAYIIAEAFVYVMKWISEFEGMPEWFEIILLFSKMVPTACLLMMLIFSLRGAADAYEEMGKKSKRLGCLRTEVYIIAAFASQIMLNVVISLENGTENLSVFAVIFISIVYIFNVAIMIIMYVRVKNFSYDYYIYSYNNQK